MVFEVKLGLFTLGRHYFHSYTSDKLIMHYRDVIASQITSLTIVYLAIYSGADQRIHQSPASLAFVRGIH